MATSLRRPRTPGSLSLTEAWLYVEIEVEAPATADSIVAFGDSTTDGFVAATPLREPVSLAVADKNGGYPDDLLRRLDAAGIPLSVANAGIGSNRLVADAEPLMLGLSGVQRFGRTLSPCPASRASCSKRASTTSDSRRDPPPRPT